MIDRIRQLEQIINHYEVLIDFLEKENISLKLEKNKDKHKVIQMHNVELKFLANEK